MLNLKFTTLTPVHISNGEQLGFGLDYIIKNEAAFYRLNPLKIAKKFSDNNLFDFKKYYSLESIIDIFEKNKKDITEDDIFYKVLITKPFHEHINNPKSTGQKYVSEFVNSNGKFYIPASSIKGTLLTILNQKSLGIDPNPNNSVITDKVIFSDSEFIDQTNFNIFTSNNRPPKVNLMCLKKGIAFNLNMKKIGQLNVSNFRNKLKEYCKNQMFLALQKIAPFKSESEQLKGADLMESALNNINNLILADDEYLINLGFGGGSWFKVEKGKTPIFKSKKPGRNNPDEPAHTTVSFNSEQPIQIGWCKLKIEEA